MKRSSEMMPIQVEEPKLALDASVLAPVESSVFYLVVKCCIDILVSLVSILLLIPVFIIIAVCIKLDDRGPVLHFREIVGFRGRRFWAWKFRTMIVDADAYLFKHPEVMKTYLRNMKLEQDPRVTRVGRFLRKTSLDELPQLFNILFGQMSLVGPRIIHPSELPRYGVYGHKRLSVKPGLTGLWQVSGRQHVSYEERVTLDMHYIDHRSILFDLKIIVKTFKVFFIHTGA